MTDGTAEGGVRVRAWCDSNLHNWLGGPAQRCSNCEQPYTGPAGTHSVTIPASEVARLVAGAVEKAAMLDGCVIVEGLRGLQSEQMAVPVAWLVDAITKPIHLRRPTP